MCLRWFLFTMSLHCWWLVHPAQVRSELLPRLVRLRAFRSVYAFACFWQTCCMLFACPNISPPAVQVTCMQMRSWQLCSARACFVGELANM